MKVVIKNGVLKKIKGGNDLTSFEIPEGVTSIDPKVFRKCPSLEKVIIPGSIKTVTSEMIKAIYAGGSKIKEFDLKEGVEAIDKSAFYFNKILEKISFPNSLVKIDNDAFSYCENLKDVSIPGNVQLIGLRAFSDCSSIKNLQIENGVKTIEEEAFYNCGMDKVHIPSSLKKIGESAFCDCKSMKTLHIEEGELEHIGDLAFYGCESLEEAMLNTKAKFTSKIFIESTNIKNIKSSPNTWNIYRAAEQKFQSIHLLKDGYVLATKDEESFEKSNEKNNVAMSCNIIDMYKAFYYIDMCSFYASNKNNLAKLIENTTLFNELGIRIRDAKLSKDIIFEKFQQKNFKRLKPLYEHIKENVKEEMNENEREELFMIADRLGVFESDDAKISIKGKEYPVADLALKVLKKAFEPIDDKELGKKKISYASITRKIHSMAETLYDFDPSVLENVIEHNHFETMRKIITAEIKNSIQSEQSKTTIKR